MSGHTYRVRRSSYCGLSLTIAEGLTHEDATTEREHAIRAALRRHSGLKREEHTQASGDTVEVSENGSGMVPDAAGYYSIEAYPPLVCCAWCGTSFQPEREIPAALRRRATCSHTCGVAYSGADCRCEECNPSEEPEQSDDDSAEEGAED